MIAILTKPAPENIVQLNNISWDTFNNILKELGNKRNELLTYDLGILEIMSPLGEHENNNRFIDDIIRAIADELNLNLKKFGSLTLKSKQLRQAVEPDSCYYLENEPLVRNKQHIDLTIDPVPDLVLEIDITNSSLNKLPIYANFRVPEIWRYDGTKLTVFILDKSNNIYIKTEKSNVFSWLDLDLIPRLIEKSLEEGETSTLREFRLWMREKIKN